MATTITLDASKLDRNQAFAIIEMIGTSVPEEYDNNWDAVSDRIAENAFRWIKEAEIEGNEEQQDLLREVYLPDDYDDEGIWYDTLGNRYDHSDWSYTAANTGITYFDECGWLDASAKRWELVEEGARIHSIAVAQDKKYPEFESGLHGRVTGIAIALATLTKGLAPKAEEAPDAAYWLEYIEGYAEGNYENGERF